MGNDSPFDDNDELFSVGDIFSRQELLRVGHVPESNRIVGRDEAIQEVGSALAYATQGGAPDNMILYGKTGTGKSLVSRHVSRRALRQARENGVKFIHTYVDCSNADTETRVARQMAMSVRDDLDPSREIPRSGIGASEYYQYLWELLGEADVFLVILDEVDKLQDDNVLMQLSRAEESGKTECYVGVISISNKIEYRERLNERINSSLQDREFVFTPYTAPQLRDILENRSDAFQPGVLDDSVIPKTAALAAKEHGDARKAIEILHAAGQLAESQAAGSVTESHLDEAQRETEVTRFVELIRGSTPHVKLILRALAQLTKQNSEEMFSTHEIYDVYKTIAESKGTSPLTYDRVYRLLKEQSFLGVTETPHTGGGRGEGSYLEHRLMRDPDVVLDALDEPM